MSHNIFVTKPFLPPFEEYNRRLQAIYQSNCLTNNGPMVRELEESLKTFLGVNQIENLSNGTLALQIGLKALDIENGEVITTPFSYVATVNSILWERCTPIFVDIEPHTFTLDPAGIEEAISPATKAIMPVHTFGYACDVEAIERIADKHGLKVIYDGAHAFGSRFKGRSLLSYGDVSTLSFHATKLFHTVEGGGCVCSSKQVAEKISLLKRFGHEYENHICVGTNAKMSELHAAMGLSILPHMPEILAMRQKVAELYDNLLEGRLERPLMRQEQEYNFAYYPVLFPNEKMLLKAFTALNKEAIFPRRYFYPSLNTLSYLPKTSSCPVSEDISTRIACLPYFPGLKEQDVHRICRILLSAM